MLEGFDDFQNISDEDLVELCKADDRNNEKTIGVLISRYIKIIGSKAQKMANSAVDADDLMQEGFLGLLDAVRTFDKTSETKFSTYSNVCITNKMTTALIKSNRIDVPIEEVEESPIADQSHTPENIFIEKEKYQELDDEVSSHLSEREWQIFRLFLRGSTYDQMARQLNVSRKTVDNALQRVRRKLKSVWRADHF